MEEKEFAAGNVEAMAQEEFSLKGAVFNTGFSERTCCNRQELVNGYILIGHGVGREQELERRSDSMVLSG